MRASKTIAVLIILFATYLLFIKNSLGNEIIEANEILPEGWKIKSIYIEDFPYGYLQQKDHDGIHIYLAGTTEVEDKGNLKTTESISLWLMPLEYKGEPVPQPGTPEMAARFIGKTTKYKLFAKATYKIPTWQNWKDDLIKYYKISNEDKRQIVLEMIDRKAMRDTMPEPKVITFEEYIKTKDKYILKMRNYKPGYALTYEEKSGDKPGGYWLTLESFDDKWVWIADLRQYKSKGWDWIGRFQIERNSQVDEEFQINSIIKARSQIIGGVRYGMPVGEVISMKGEPKEINVHQEGGSADLIYDDVIVSVRQWVQRNNTTGRVIGVKPIKN